MSETERPAPAEGGREQVPPGPRVMNEEKKFPRGLVIRLFAYLVAGHLFAGFLYLLFHVGAQGR
ncbi:MULTISPECIES: DUF6126 family protein [unclassified Streptomyces]|uniref:DUF6126 family protein n=1 Tax=unclassified Streptomyces TaxID=2593676 RepID=UPI0036417BFC